MSQHIIGAKESKHFVMVGYDRPLDNFFGTVYENGDVIEWIPGEPTAAAVAKQLEPFATISPEIITTLENERIDRAKHPMSMRVDHRTKVA